MKAVCILLFCLAAVAYASFDEIDADEESHIEVRTTKKLPGGYTFITKSIGGGKYNCECFRAGKRVWPGMCGVKDRSFSYSNCA